MPSWQTSAWGRSATWACSTRPPAGPTSLLGADAYPDLDHKAAALLESIVGNHRLVDGNKWLGWLATVVFGGLSGVTLDGPEDDAFEPRHLELAAPLLGVTIYQ